MQTIPTPKAPRLLQASQWILDPLGYMKANFKKYGDIFTAHVSWGEPEPMVMVNEPKTIQFMLTHDTGKEFSAPGELNEILEPLIGRQNLFLLSGQQHRRRRQLVMPPFHGENLKGYAQTIRQITQQVLAELPGNEPWDVREAMQKITMRVILQVVFGLHQGDRYEKLERLLGKRMDMTGTPLASAIVFLPWLQKNYGPWSPGGLIRKLAEATDELLFAEIQERRSNPDPNRRDILSLLLATKDEEGNGLSNQDLRDELMTLLVAGHETTATALAWAMYWIQLLPDIKQKVLAELNGISDLTEPSNFLNLPYLTAVCNETLRIYPVAMLTFPRRVETPLELVGYRLEPGTIVIGCIYLIHQRQDLYPQPQQFRPERFLEQQFSPYEFMPFGGGVRRCIGSALAQYEMKIVLGTILSQVDLALVNKQSVQPGRRGVTLGQKSAILMRKVGTRSASRTLLEV